MRCLCLWCSVLFPHHPWPCSFWKSCIEVFPCACEAAKLKRKQEEAAKAISTFWFVCLQHLVCAEFSLKTAWSTWFFSASCFLADHKFAWLKAIHDPHAAWNQPFSNVSSNLSMSPSNYGWQWPVMQHTRKFYCDSLSCQCLLGGPGKCFSHWYFWGC